MTESVPRILIVDDLPINIQIMAEFLSADYRISSANDGPSALELAESVKPDLILLDIMMPGMDGFEVFRRIREIDNLVDTPIIFITALGEEASEVQGLELGAVDYITKPVNCSLMRLRVRNQLELKRQRDTLRQRTLDLESALARINRLEGIISICMYCKKIRNDKQDSWQQLEQYITEHSDARFSHGICPACFEKTMKTMENGSTK